jgi:hypothetical protein
LLGPVEYLLDLELTYPTTYSTGPSKSLDRTEEMNSPLTVKMQMV